MEVSDVANIHDPEIEPRAAGHSTHEARYQFNRGGRVRSEDRSEDAGRIDRREFERTSFGRHEVPGRAFGDGLRSHIGAHLSINIGPARLVERRSLRRVTSSPAWSTGARFR